MGLGVLDLVLLVGSLLATSIIGICFSKNYMQGSRQISWLTVAIQLMTSSLMNGLTLLGACAEFYYQGPSYAFVSIPMLLSGPITAWTMLPVFHRMNTLSLHKYLQKRYGLVVKYIVTVVFSLQMVALNAVVLYVPSMATSSLLGISRHQLILAIGFLCILHSAMGGLKAVVWTDLFQVASMFVALFALALLGTRDAGGLAGVWREVQSNGRTDLHNFLQLDLTTRHTLFGILVGSTLKNIYLVAANQNRIQRALSLPTLRQGQMSFVWFSFCGAIIILLSTYLGAVLVAAYRSCDPYQAGEITRREALLVHYVSHRLSKIPGLRGLFVAGIFVATLSTLSTFTNSMAALAMEDFPWGPLDGVWLPRGLAMCFGVACVLMAQLIEKSNSRLLQLNSAVTSAIGTPFLVSFGLGVFTRFVNSWGILVGFATTLSLGGYITIRQSFFRVPLKAAMPVYYEASTCSRVFNGTMPASSLDSVVILLKSTELSFFLPPAEFLFSVDKISYKTLIVVQFVLIILIAPTVSLLTGGSSQQVDDELLAESMQRCANCYYPSAQATNKTKLVGSKSL